MKELLHDVPMNNDLSADYAPKSIQLARILRTRIQRGEFSNGEYFSRIKLAAEYDVSPGTVLRALSALFTSGYVRAEEYFPKRTGYRFRVAYPQPVPGGQPSHETLND
jgi:DNA-binding transcriptional MocR family regulator